MSETERVKPDVKPDVKPEVKPEVVIDKVCDDGEKGIILYIIVFDKGKVKINDVRGDVDECIGQLKNKWRSDRNEYALLALYDLGRALNREGWRKEVKLNLNKAIEIFKYLKKINWKYKEKAKDKYNEIKKSLEEKQNNIESSSVTIESDTINNLVAFEVPDKQSENDIKEEKKADQNYNENYFEEEEEVDDYINQQNEEKKKTTQNDNEIIIEEEEEPSSSSEEKEKIEDGAKKLSQLKKMQNLGESIGDYSSNEEEEEKQINYSNL